MNVLRDTSRLERMVAVQMLQQVKSRIFDQGKDSNGGQIGNYSAAYMKQRRAKNFPSSTQVILQATGQMHSDFQYANDGDQFGLGFKNANIDTTGKKKVTSNSDKAEAVERTYGKEIFKLTDSETKNAHKIVEIEVNKILNGK